MIPTVLTLIAVLLIVRWFLWSERVGRLPPERADPELGRLRDEVDRLSGQVERLADEQRFLLRLLDERPPPALPPPEPPAEPRT